MVLAREQVERAVELQARGYQLLQWLEKALDEGFIAPEAAHAYATIEASASAWIERHYQNLPEVARPDQQDLRSFSKLFSTYLTNTFDLDADPGKRLYSPDAHCFCPLCSWMVRVPHLRPKKIGAADRKIADRMRRAFIRSLATEIGAQVSEEVVDDMLHDQALREPLGLCTYATDLLQRLEGIAVGAASLVLWRSFAWTPQGSPKKRFVLSADAIVAGQQTVVQHILRCSTSSAEPE